jgi:hypothetical protein
MHYDAGAIKVKEKRILLLHSFQTRILHNEEFNATTPGCEGAKEQNKPGNLNREPREPREREPGETGFGILTAWPMKPVGLSSV